MVGLDRYLGTARTGRKVGLYVTNDLEYIRSQIADYDPHENFDAYCILQWHMVEAIRRYGLEAEDLKILEFMSDLHWQTLTDEFIDNEKLALSLPTSIALVQYGKSLVPPFLKD